MAKPKAEKPEDETVEEAQEEKKNPFADFPQTHGQDSELSRRIQSEQAQEKAGQ